MTGTGTDPDARITGDVEAALGHPPEAAAWFELESDVTAGAGLAGIVASLISVFASSRRARLPRHFVLALDGGRLLAVSFILTKKGYGRTVASWGLDAVELRRHGWSIEIRGAGRVVRARSSHCSPQAAAVLDRLSAGDIP